MRTLLLIAVALFWIGHASAAPPHSITYAKKNAAPGTIVPIGGEDYVIVRVPIRDFGGTARYSVTFLAPTFEGQFFNATLSTSHQIDPIENSLLIDGFPATLFVGDGRSYQINVDFLSGDQEFSVDAIANATVSVQVGATVLSFFALLTTPQQAATLMGTPFNAQPEARFNRYVDPVALINALDKWIDYIRIIPLN